MSSPFDESFTRRGEERRREEERVRRMMETERLQRRAPHVHGEEFIGRRGERVVPRSESRVLHHAVAALQTIAHGYRGDNRPLLSSVISDLKRLATQVEEGYHRNPAGLVIYGGNPPLRARRVDIRGAAVKGTISLNVHAIQYQHAEDRRNYEHTFDSETHMLALERGGIRDVLLTSPDGLPLWDDF